MDLVFYWYFCWNYFSSIFNPTLLFALFSYFRYYGNASVSFDWMFHSYSVFIVIFSYLISSLWCLRHSLWWLYFLCSTISFAIFFIHISVAVICFPNNQFLGHFQTHKMDNIHTYTCIIHNLFIYILNIHKPLNAHMCTCIHISYYAPLACERLTYFYTYSHIASQM